MSSPPKVVIELGRARGVFVKPAHVSRPAAILKWLAVAVILGTGFIHVIEAKDAFGDASYKGLLFVGNGLGAALAAQGIVRNKGVLGWAMGFLVAGGALLGYVASRTVGLPGLPAEPEAWFEPMGVVSVACETIFVVIFFATRKARARSTN